MKARVRTLAVLVIGLVLTLLVNMEAVAASSTTGSMAQSADGLVLFMSSSLEKCTGQTVDSCVRLDRSIFVKPGDTVRATIWVNNVSNHAVTVKRLVLAGRGPGAAEQGWNAPNVDWPARTNFTIPAGTGIRWSSERQFTSPGDYFAEPSYQNAAGVWGGIPLQGGGYDRTWFTVAEASQKPPTPAPGPTPIDPNYPSNIPWFIDCARNGDDLPCPPAVLNVSELDQDWKESVIAAARTWNNVGTEFQFQVTALTDADRDILMAEKEGRVKFGKEVGWREVRVVQASKLDEEVKGGELQTWYQECSPGATTAPLGIVVDGKTFMGGALVILNDLGWSWWKSNADNPDTRLLDLQGVALHELGHALGLAHLRNEESVMGRHIEGGGESCSAKLFRALQPDDIASIKSIYRTLGIDFPQTGKTITGRFAEVWQGGRSYDDSVYINGLPISDALDEVSPTDGKTYKTQWFERARLELHPENQPPFDVLLGLLGTTAVKSRQDEAPFRPVQRPVALKEPNFSFHAFNSLDPSRFIAAETVQWFPETQHTLGDSSEGGQAIARFWSNLGGLAQFGYPLSQPFMEQSKDDGKMYLVQYFERQRFEYHPENKGTGYEVLLGRLGAEQMGSPATGPSSGTPNTAPDSEEITLANVSGLTLRHKLTGNFGGNLSDGTISPNGDLVATGSAVPPNGAPGDVRIWRVSDGELLHVLTGHTQAVLSVHFSPDGQTLASSSYDHTLKLWKVSDGSLIRSLSTCGYAPTDITFSPDGQSVAASTCGLTIWRVADGAELQHISWPKVPDWAIRYPAFSPDGQLIVANCGVNGAELTVWRVADGSVVRNLPQESEVYNPLFTPDGQSVIGEVGARSLRLWKVADGSLVKRLDHNDSGIAVLAFSPNGQLLAQGVHSSTGGYTISLLNAATWEKTRDLSDAIKSIWRLEFSRDGRFLLSASGDNNYEPDGPEENTLRIWSLRR